MEQEHVLWVSFGLVNGFSTKNESIRCGIHCISRNRPLRSEFNSSTGGVQIGNNSVYLNGKTFIIVEVKYSQIFAIFGRFLLVYQEFMIYCKQRKRL